MRAKENMKGILLFICDVVAINLAYIMSFYIRIGNLSNEVYKKIYISYIPLILVIYIFMIWKFKMYKSIWKIAGADEVIACSTACLLGGVLNLVILEFMPFRVPRVVTALACFFIIMFTLSIRLSFSIYRKISRYGYIFEGGYERTLIIGAGECGQLLLEEIRKNTSHRYNVVGFIDDNISKSKKYLKGVKILGNRDDIAKVVKSMKINTIIFAIPSISAREKQLILEKCKDTKTNIKIVPSFYETIDSEIKLSQVRDIDLRDLLGREEVKLDKVGISEYITDKIVLVTGGGGSIGSELCRQIATFNPSKLLILDIYENSTYDLENELNRSNQKLDKKVFIASVRDKRRLEAIFEEFKPNVVFHAAAHKHVPLMENNPQEAIKNNVMGTLNVAEAADKFNCDKFVLISTDKAVNPTNVMGATKRICEMIIQAINRESKTEFVAVRFGNVLGSNGSVIPLFQKQISEGGPITLTHKDIIRYFMLIPEATQLVLQAGAYAKGGEIFILDMGKPVKIYDLALNLIKLSGFEPNEDIKIEITGLRPGEKLYEELLMDEESIQKTKHEKIFIGKPAQFNIEELKEKINEIFLIALDGNEELIKYKLKQIVPTYRYIDKEKAELKLD